MKRPNLVKWDQLIASCAKTNRINLKIMQQDGNSHGLCKAVLGLTDNLTEFLFCETKARDISRFASCIWVRKCSSWCITQCIYMSEYCNKTICQIYVSVSADLRFRILCGEPDRLVDPLGWITWESQIILLLQGRSKKEGWASLEWIGRLTRLIIIFKINKINLPHKLIVTLRR